VAKIVVIHMIARLDRVTVKSVRKRGVINAAKQNENVKNVRDELSTSVKRM
jgi:hypothetical protein